MPVWTIAGETGKAWDGTQQTLEFRAIAGANITFRSLAVDELTLDIQVEDATTYTAPELGQIVRLYRNGDLFFTGHVTSNPFTFSQRNQSLRIVVSGPWWWMDRINYTSTQTDGTGATATRMTGVFGTASSGTNLKTAIETAINRMVVLGVPIANIAGGSSVATFFTVPRVTLNQSTCSQVISELVRLVPDTMVYFDYSTTTPTIQVTRRGVATTRTITIGTDEVESLDIQPLYEMKVDRVELPFVDRDAVGLTRFQQQASGTAATGRVQIITVSGTELDTFLPNDLFETITVSTFPIASFESFALRDSQFAEAIQNGLTTQLDFPITQKQYIGGDTSGLSGGVYVQQTLQGISVVDANGQPVSTTGKFFMTASDMPKWAIDENGFIPIKITGRYAFEWNDLNYVSPYRATDTQPGVTLPTWVSSLNMTQLDAYFTDAGIIHRSIKLLVGTYTIDAYLSPTQFGTTASTQTIYKDADYTFIAPPANLAANLLAAQNFVPYEGAIVLTQETAGGTRYRGCKVNVANSLTEHSTMGALVAEESLDLATGQTTITLGTPPRLDYRTFVDRIRKTPQDNIVFV